MLAQFMQMMPNARDSLLQTLGLGAGAGAAVGQGLMDMFAGGARRAGEFSEFL
jgi:hypothetical protein